MADELDELVKRWRAAGGSTAVLSREVDKVAREIALKAARKLRLSEDDAEDVTQFVCAKLVSMLEDGDYPRTSASGLVWRMSRNRARDLLRRQQRQDEQAERIRYEEAATGAKPTDPETLWLGRERQERLKAAVREALAKAPENYRITIQKVYIDGLPIEDVADEEYTRMVGDGEVDESDEVSVGRAKRKARNLVDKRLQRGRVWLRQRLAKDVP